MRDPDEFDVFYKDARGRLLISTYALTGDLPAARAAVRDAFVVAWHHWRKVSRLEDPEAWVRPRAWANAQRRHTTRLWHREKGLDPEVAATLEALGRLTLTQRKALLLTTLTTVSMDDMAREVGLPRGDAERELQTATAHFALHRGVPSTHLRVLLDALAQPVEDSRWQRPSIVRRAGAARRRTHTFAGAAAVVVALVLTGSLVADTDGLRPTLAGERTGTSAHHPGAAAAPQPVALPRDAMLLARQVAAHVPARRWHVTATHDNTEGNGLVVPCQQARYADPHGTAALVRTFDTTPRRRAPAVAAVQTTEVSARQRAARKAYRTEVGWYAGCTAERVQLLSTTRVDGVGDEAMQLVLRSWNRPATTMVVGVARTGLLTTTTMSRTATADAPRVAGPARLLGTAVEQLCTLPGGGACVGTPRLTSVSPPPVGSAPGMLAEVDLPPVSTVTGPWVGTEPRKAMTNVASTGCDRADFSARGISHNVTRTFLIPGAAVPDQFGLTQTVGAMPVKQARAFVGDVRSRMAACADKEMGTDVTQLAHRAAKGRDLSVWRVRVEVSDAQEVEYLMGIVRDGTAVGQVGFVPTPKVQMAPGAFEALVQRALDRLAALPAPARG